MILNSFERKKNDMRNAPMKRFRTEIMIFMCGIIAMISTLTVYAYTPSDELKKEEGKYYYKGREVTSYEYIRLNNRLIGFNTYEDAYKSVIEGYKCNETDAAYMQIYLDNDDIPELLVMEGGKNSGGGVIYYYSNKHIKRVRLYESETFGKNGTFGYVPYKGRVLHESVERSQGNTTVIKKLFYVDIRTHCVDSRSEYIEQHLAGKTREEGSYRVNGRYVEEDEYNFSLNVATEGMISVRYEDCIPIIKNSYESTLHNAKSVKRHIYPNRVTNAFEFPMVWRFIAGDTPAYYGKYYECYDEKEVEIKDVLKNGTDSSAVQVNNMWDFNNGGSKDEIFIEGEYGGSCFDVRDDRVYMMLRGEDHLYNLDYTEVDGDMWLFTYAVSGGEWQNYEFWKFNWVGEIVDSLRLEYAYDNYWIDNNSVKQSEWYKTRDKMLKNAHHRSWIVGEKE